MSLEPRAFAKGVSVETVRPRVASLQQPEGCGLMVKVERAANTYPQLEISLSAWYQISRASTELAGS